MKKIKLIGLLIVGSFFLLSACKDILESEVVLYDLKLSGHEVVVVPTGGSEIIGVVFVPIHTTNKSVEWTSSDPSIVTVEDGVITGVREGKATVEGVSVSNPQKKVSVQVTVNPIPIESLTLDREGTLDMEVSEVLQLSAIITPENAPQQVEWISSNEHVATVSAEGEVTTLRGGEVIITARSYADASKSASVTINVSNPNEIILSQPANNTLLDGYEMSYPVNFIWIKAIGVTDYVLKISNDQDDFSGAWTKTLGNIESYAMDDAEFQTMLDHFSVLPDQTIQLYWSVQQVQEMDNVDVNVNAFSVKRAFPLLDRSKFVALPHSTRFNFSQWGTSDLSILWDGSTMSGLAGSTFYIENKVETYFGVDLGVKANLSKFVYWGRHDQYFQLRHPKKLQLYGTNDASIANNPESPDSQWILLTDNPLVSVRPSGETTGIPTAGHQDYEYARKGESFTLPAGKPAVRYVRVKCLETWGQVEGLWSREIAFRGIEE